jgi:hypothetical protein
MPKMITLEINHDEVKKMLDASFKRVETELTKKGGVADKMVAEALQRALRPIMRQAMTQVAEELSGKAIVKADRAIAKLMLEAENK